MQKVGLMRLRVGVRLMGLTAGSGADEAESGSEANETDCREWG